jgi:hypothetical protein
VYLAHPAGRETARRRLGRHATGHDVRAAVQRQERSGGAPGRSLCGGGPPTGAGRRFRAEHGQECRLCGCADVLGQSTGQHQFIVLLLRLHGVRQLQQCYACAQLCALEQWKWPQRHPTKCRVPIFVCHPADAAAEKNTRASFKAEVDRRLSRKTVVILDALNNIKGFRCAATCMPHQLKLHSLKVSKLDHQ